MRTLIAIFISVILLTGCNSSKETETNTSVYSDEFLSKAVIYEVNVRQYTQEGTFDAFATYLPKASVTTNFKINVTFIGFS